MTQTIFPEISGINIDTVHGRLNLAIASPAIHGVSAHSGNIGTESQVAFVVTGGHSHDGVGSTEVTYSNLAGIPMNFASSVHDASHKDSGVRLGNSL